MQNAFFPMGIGYILVAATSCSAGLIVAPNANTSVQAPNVSAFFHTQAVVFQWVLSASQFGSVPIGSLLTGIGFRLGAGFTSWPSTIVNYSAWDLQISSSLNGPLTMSSTFANNIGSDATLVRSGSLSIDAGALAAGAQPNPFFLIPFTTTYTYAGSDVLITLRHSALDSGGLGFVEAHAHDAVGNAASATPATAPRGGLGLNYPITEFQFTAATPEPGTFGMWVTLLGLVLIAGARRSIRGRFSGRRREQPGWGDDRGCGAALRAKR